ncbi:uncharacterized protein LOC127637196 [Xyrauchen texanus]|uniref:uncharacterized protein LOC127637196 n=1 Tax=Xyrauchen texanus TaxID=154827 RepID=UPI0022421D06|nr:uncharacterized protein LOC127637196 [Xyrauchen texanus]
MTFLHVLLLLWAFPPSDASHRLRTFHFEGTRNIPIKARAICTQNYTDLVTVYDEQDNLELTKIIKPPSALIGVYTSIGTNKWSNGDEVTFSKLNGNCGEICCAAMKADGEWESVQYNTPKYFMCYDQVTIRDETENNQVKEKGKSSSNPFWIGLLRDDFEWVDGGKSAYRKYPLDQPSGTGNVTILPGGHWTKLPNTNNFNALCYKSHIHVSNEKMSWENALDYCDNNGNTSGLLRIESKDDQIETERELRRRNISGPVWVGLRQSRLFGFWIWSNGLHVGPWTNWKGGSQPEHQMSHHCGAIEKMNGVFKWTDKDCRSQFTVLCERK